MLLRREEPASAPAAAEEALMMAKVDEIGERAVIAPLRSGSTRQQKKKDEQAYTAQHTCKSSRCAAQWPARSAADRPGDVNRCNDFAVFCSSVSFLFFPLSASVFVCFVLFCFFLLCLVCL